MSYEKHTWETGETITAEKLNNLEDEVDNISNFIKKDKYLELKITSDEQSPYYELYDGETKLDWNSFYNMIEKNRIICSDGLNQTDSIGKGVSSGGAPPDCIINFFKIESSEDIISVLQYHMAYNGKISMVRKKIILETI